MDIRLDRKRALVTGGNSGIGEAIALALVGTGAKVAINYVAHPEVALDVVDNDPRAGSRAAWCARAGRMAGRSSLTPGAPTT
jgi:glucose 1-dehydrogenase